MMYRMWFDESLPWCAEWKAAAQATAGVPQVMKPMLEPGWNPQQQNYSWSDVEAVLRFAFTVVGPVPGAYPICVEADQPRLQFSLDVGSFQYLVKRLLQDGDPQAQQVLRQLVGA